LVGGLKARRSEGGANAAAATRRLSQRRAHLFAKSSHQAVLREQNFVEHLESGWKVGKKQRN
jgi:hypothetical protein